MSRERLAFSVASGSGSGRHEVVAVGGEVVNCDCKGWLYRGRCRHADEVEALLEAEKGQDRLAFGSEGFEDMVDRNERDERRWRALMA